MVSWLNVKAELGHLTWDDYVETGVIEALRVAQEIAGSDKVNALGFCVGGTLVGAALAVLRAKGEDIVASSTYLTTMLDFSDTGQIGCLVDEQGTQLREQAIGSGGHPARVRARVRVLGVARQRPHLAVRGQQLPQGRIARGVRPALLERRQHQPARADVLLVREGTPTSKTACASPAP